MNEAVLAEKGTKKQRGKEKQGLPNPCVYCGPSVRGIAQQYTVYSGALPPALEKLAEQSAAAQGLLVSLDRFPFVRRALGRSGSAEAAWYRRLRKELTGEE